MALEIQREIIKEIQSADFYSIMADETADVFNVEQLVNCIRWVDDDLEVHKEFIGLHPLDSTDAESIFNVLKVMFYSALKIKLLVERLSRKCSFFIEFVFSMFFTFSL